MNANNPNEVFTVIGQNLKRLRKKAGMTQEEFAVESCYSLGFIMNLESNSYSQSVSLGTVWAFAKVLNVEIKEFFEPIN